MDMVVLHHKRIGENIAKDAGRGGGSKSKKLSP